LQLALRTGLYISELLELSSSLRTVADGRLDAATRDFLSGVPPDAVGRGSYDGESQQESRVAAQQTLGPKDPGVFPWFGKMAAYSNRIE
jgi:hypothetical protein